MDYCKNSCYHYGMLWPLVYIQSVISLFKKVKTLLVCMLGIEGTMQYETQDSLCTSFKIGKQVADFSTIDALVILRAKVQ